MENKIAQRNNTFYSNFNNMPEYIRYNEYIDNFINGGLEKIAQESKEPWYMEGINKLKNIDYTDYSTYLTPALAISSFFIAPWIIKKTLNSSNSKIHEKMKKAIGSIGYGNTDEIINKVKKESDLEDIPHSILDNYPGAAYIYNGMIKKEEIPKLNEEANKLLNSKNEKDKSTGQFILKTIEYSNMPNGGIVIGKKFNDPIVIAHELGHADIYKKQTWNKLIPQASRILKNIGLPLTLSGLITSFFLPGMSKTLFLSGLATTLAGDIGHLYNEYNASNTGTNILNKSLYDPKNINKRKQILQMGLMSHGVHGTSSVLSNLARYGAISMI